jgi:hypothetical protein
MLWQRGKAYSQDLRERVLVAADDGVPVGRIAALLRVSSISLFDGLPIMEIDGLPASASRRR